MSVQMMELGTTSNHFRANPLQPTNPESRKSATHPDDSTGKFESFVGHHVDAPGCGSRIGSSSSARGRRRSSCGVRCINKASHTKWLTDSQTSMSLCTLKSWVLSLCILLSTMHPHVIASAVKVTDSPVRPVYGGINIQKATTTRSASRRGEFLIGQFSVTSNRLGKCFKSRFEPVNLFEFSNCVLVI